MNCPRQTANGTIAASSMATLLQKNCIKTLTVNNGVVMVNASSNGNSVGQPTSQTGVIGTMQTHTITGQPLTNVAASRVLLPHELGSLAVQSQPLHQTFQFHQQLQTQSAHLPAQQQQYIYYNNNANLSNSTTTYVTHNNIPKPSSLGAIQFNSNSTIANVTSVPAIYGTATTTGPIFMTANKSSQPKLNQIIAANSFASSPVSSINRTTYTTATTTPPIASAVAVKREEEISNQSDGIQRNGTASITDNNNTNYSPTSNSSPTIQTNDIKHTTSTNNLIGHGSIADTSKKSPSPPPPSTTDSVADDANDQEIEPEPEIDIVINNVVCSFSVRCHLNLREIALNGRNVEFRRENGMVTMKLRRPYTTASIWSSGRITCTGATSEDQVSISRPSEYFCFLHFVFLIGRHIHMCLGENWCSPLCTLLAVIGLSSAIQ